MVRRVATGDLDPTTKDRTERERFESLRERGRYRDLVLWQLGCGEAWQREANGAFRTRVGRARPMRQIPLRDDLIAASNESPDPLPAPIVDYIIKFYLKALPRKTGQRPRPTLDDDRLFQRLHPGVHEHPR